MKKRNRLRYAKTIALLHHKVDAEESETTYFSPQHRIVDSDTSETVTYLKKIFKNHGYHVQVVIVYPDDLSNLKKLHADYVFNLVDSKAMEIQILKVLDRLNVLYSGSKIESLRISNNKIKVKRLLERAGLPTPKYTVIRPSDRITKSLIPGKYPLIVKPAFEHCSIGISNHSIVKNYEQFKAIVKSQRQTFKQTLIAEEFIQGREFHLTVFESGNQTLALPLAEMVYQGKTKNKWNIYEFDAKWKKESALYKSVRFVAPAVHIEPTVREQMQRDAIRAFYTLGFRDYARFDLRYNPQTKRWFFLEGNANAGISADHDDAMTAAIEAYGMTLDEFILNIVGNTLGKKKTKTKNRSAAN
jgi:D-alanine-D-alanine ligase